MSTRVYKGAAEIEYQPLVGDAVVHLLAVPLLISPASGFTATRRRRLWTAWSADFTERETFTLGTAVDEIIGTVRFDDQPAELRELIRAGLEDDVPMIYRPHGVEGNEFPCKLVVVPGAGQDEIPLVPDRVGYAEYTVPLLLRRVDGGTWDDLLDNSGGS